VIAGQQLTWWMFVMRLSRSRRAFHVGFGTPAEEAFVEGHVVVFDRFGGIPVLIRYDNLKPAVVRVLRAGAGPSPNGSSRCAVIAASTPSSAAAASRVLTRRVAAR